MWVPDWVVFLACVAMLASWGYTVYVIIYEHKFRQPHKVSVHLQEDEFVEHMIKLGLTEEDARQMLKEYDYPDLIIQNKRLRKINKKA